MKINIGMRELLKHLSFWHNKTDTACIKMASNEYGVDASRAVTNMLERDFCTEMNISIAEELIKDLKN